MSIKNVVKILLYRIEKVESKSLNNITLIYLLLLHLFVPKKNNVILF